MPQATRETKRHIKSISSIRKITKAMELVSVAKMRRATKAVLASRAYADLAWQTIQNLAARADSKHSPLLTKRPIKKIASVLITSNRGLAGSFNNQIIALALNFLAKKKQAGKEVFLFTLGKKGRDAILRKKLELSADFPKVDVTTEVSEISALAKLLLYDFLSGKFDQVMLFYTDYMSALKQKPRAFQLLPLSPEKSDEELGEVGEKPEMADEKIGANIEYLFEPSAKQILTEMLPRLLQVKIYQAVLESDASEHSARMVAMQNASEAASDMIFELTQIFNKARQAAITSELADISGGRLALE